MFLELISWISQVLHRLRELIKYRPKNQNQLTSSKKKHIFQLVLEKSTFRFQTNLIFWFGIISFKTRQKKAFMCFVSPTNATKRLVEERKKKSFQMVCSFSD